MVDKVYSLRDMAVKPVAFDNAMTCEGGVCPVKSGYVAQVTLEDTQTGDHYAVVWYPKQGWFWV